MNRLDYVKAPPPTPSGASREVSHLKDPNSASGALLARNLQTYLSETCTKLEERQ